MIKFHKSISACLLSLLLSNAHASNEAPICPDLNMDDFKTIYNKCKDTNTGCTKTSSPSYKKDESLWGIDITVDNFSVDREKDLGDKRYSFGPYVDPKRDSHCLYSLTSKSSEREDYYHTLVDFELIPMTSNK